MNSRCLSLDELSDQISREWWSSMNIHRLFITISIYHTDKIFASQIGCIKETHQRAISQHGVRLSDTRERVKQAKEIFTQDDNPKLGLTKKNSNIKKIK